MFVAVYAVAQDRTPHYKKLSVSIPNLICSADERIVGFEIEITAGMVRSVSNLPMGWHLIVDNDASWRTKITGTTEVGAAALSPSDLKKLRLLVTKDGTESAFAVTGTASVTKDFQNSRSIALRGSDFAVSKVN